MALFFENDEEGSAEGRKEGFPRYRELLERHWKEFLAVGFLTLVFHIPFAGGLVYAALSSSALLALCAGLVGGAIAGPGLSCMYDLILRRLRNDKGDAWTCWKRAFRQNWRASLLPGIVQSMFISMLAFSGFVIYQGARPATLGTLLLLLFAALFVTMLMSVWWPQVALFDQKQSLRLKNGLFFILFHPWPVLGAALLQLLWWAVLFLFLPWTAFAVPVLGLWYILFLTQFLLYPKLNEDFKIEEKIRAAFPGRLDD